MHIKKYNFVRKLTFGKNSFLYVSLCFLYLHFLVFLRISITKEYFLEREKMKKELILLESEYSEDGEEFENILQNAIEIFLKNLVASPRQKLEDIVKYG